MKKNEYNKREIKELAEVIDEMALGKKVNLSEKKINAMWSNIESGISFVDKPEENTIAEGLRGASENLQPTEAVVSGMWSRIKDSIDYQPVPVWKRFRVPVPRSGFKRAFSGVLASIFVFVIASTSLTAVPSVAAARYSTLELIRGEVEIYRDGGTLAYSPDMTLQEGDRIVTGEASIAEINLVDDSRLTLGSHADVTILQQQVNPEDHSDTDIFVQYSSGDVWTQVIGLVNDDASFVVILDDAVLNSDYSGSFNVSIEGNRTQVQVAQNTLRYQLVGDRLRGNGIIPKGKELSIVSRTQFFVDQVPDSEKDFWWDYNLTEDDIYAKEIADKYFEDAKDRVKVLPGSPLYPVKRLGEDINEFISFSEESRIKKQMAKAETRLLEAQVVTQMGEEKLAEEVLEDFTNVHEALVEQVSEDTQKYLNTAKKSLHVQMVDNDKLYVVRQNINDAEALIVRELEPAMPALNASQKLEEIPFLVETGNYELVQEFLDEFRESAEGVDLEQLDIVKEVIYETLEEADREDIEEVKALSEELEEITKMIEETEVVVPVLKPAPVEVEPVIEEQIEKTQLIPVDETEGSNDFILLIR